MDARKFYINGTWVDPIEGRDFAVIDPSTEESCATISLGGKADTDAAVAAAKAAFPKWRLSSKAERVELLESILDIYMRRSDELAAVISSEVTFLTAPAACSTSTSTSAMGVLFLSRSVSVGGD